VNDVKIIAILSILVMVFIYSCNTDKPGPAKSESSSSVNTGRPETKGLEAAGAVGYDGAGIRRSVDKALNQNDARNAEEKKAIEQAGGK
jgi:hypothetical protein